MSVVVKPRTELMSATKPLGAARTRLKEPWSICMRLQCPMCHSERERRNRQRVSTREFKGRGGSLQQVHCIDGIHITWCRCVRTCSCNFTRIGMNFPRQHRADCGKPRCLEKRPSIRLNTTFFKRSRQRIPFQIMPSGVKSG